MLENILEPCDLHIIMFSQSHTTNIDLRIATLTSLKSYSLINLLQPLIPSFYL